MEDQKRLALLNPAYPEYNCQWDTDEIEPASILSVQADSDYETEKEDEEEEMEKPPDNLPNDLQFNPNLDEDLLSLSMKYSDVFSEKIDESRIMDTKPMKIKLRDDLQVIPIYVANPRQVPLHWRSQATSLLNTMVENGILRPVPSARAWCSPVCWVHKGSGEPLQLRLTNDFWTPHPFPSVFEVKQNIREDTTFLVSADLVSSYHQILLDEES